MSEHNLQRFGIQTPLNLLGDLRFLLEENGLPVVFLIDEHHGNLNGCIDSNIKNAIELIDKANVVLVGVESHYGGFVWDEYERGYTDEENYSLVSIKTITNTQPKFATSIKDKYPKIVFGVECLGLLNNIEMDYIHKRVNNIPLPDHPFQRERSKHFIKTLFRIMSKSNLEGNLILNCGRDHNTHIEEWIVSGEIHDIAGFKASYIRLNAIKDI